MKHWKAPIFKTLLLIIWLISGEITIPLYAQNDVPGLTVIPEGLTLTSPEVSDGGVLPTDYTGDGSSSTLPLEWTGVPEGTKSFAVIMHHVDPEGLIKEYWNLYNIPADVQFLPKNVTAVGLLGRNSHNNSLGYAPPMSQGPGAKTYTLTLYALSAMLDPEVLSTAVTRDVLLKSMEGLVLDSAALNVEYTRPDLAQPPRGEHPRDEKPPRGNENLEQGK